MKSSRAIKEVRDGDVRRIQMSVEVQDRGLHTGAFGLQEPFTVATISYLDGGVTELSGTPSDMQETRMSYDVVPVRTKETADFGRLSSAAQAMAKSLSRFSTSAPPSADQMSVLLKNYQFLLARREEAQKRLIQADGEIETVGRLLSQYVAQ